MKIKRFARTTGKMLCGISFSLVLVAAGQDSDPFASDAGGGGQEVDPFGPGGSGNDPFSSNYNPRIFRKGKASEVLKNQKEQVAVMIEMIEVDHLTANGLMLKYSKKANDVGEMRDYLMERVLQGDAKLQETLWGRSPLNEVGKIEAVVEKIYATEYEPAELPQFVVAGAGEKKEGEPAQATVEVESDLYTGATPTAFETRNVGTTLEFEAAESAEQPGKIGLSIFLQVSKFLQNDHFMNEGYEKEARGIANIVMPRFSTISQEFVATVKPGNHSLLGIFKDGGDESEMKRVIVLMHMEMIAKE